MAVDVLVVAPVSHRSQPSNAAIRPVQSVWVVHNLHLDSINFHVLKWTVPLVVHVHVLSVPAAPQSLNLQC